jgi:hypothetical protein
MRVVLVSLGLLLTVAGCGNTTVIIQPTPVATVTVTATPTSSPAPVSTPASDSLPASEQSQMRVLISPYAYVPSSMPPGFTYIDWRHSALTPTVAGQLLTIEFAAPGGRQITWTSSRACDTNGHIGPSTTGYPGYGYGMSVDRTAVIAGKRVYFSQGNQGSNAWMTFPVQTSWGTDYVSVGIWESNCITPAAAMRLVAHSLPA